MFDVLDPAGTLGQTYLNIPKGGVQSTEAPQSYEEMVANRVPGSQGGSTADDSMRQAVPGGGNQSWEQKRQSRDALYAAQEKRRQGLKKGGKVKVSSASSRADGCCIKGKTKGRIV
jgi:hypothetical protein